MSFAKHILNDVVRALVVLAMVFLCFAAAPSSASDDLTVVQQAGTIATQFQSLCGGHDQSQQLACHAPNACCRPDQAILPPNRLEAEPAFERLVAVAWTAFAPAAIARTAPPTFRSRAPPV